MRQSRESVGGSVPWRSRWVCGQASSLASSQKITLQVHMFPCEKIAETQKQSAATGIIYGLASGYLSTIIPVASLGITILVAHSLCGGVALVALGMLGTLTMGFNIDAFFPISDNAGGIAGMLQLDEWSRERTDVLGAAGNTKAIGKGFAIRSAALVSLARFGAFCVRADIIGVNILLPRVFTGLFFGVMMPYACAALTKKCILISTRASLNEMLAPGAPVILSFLCCRIFVWKVDLCGFLSGALVSSNIFPQANLDRTPRVQTLTRIL